MYKVFCLLSFIALCGYAHFDKSPDMTSASIRLALALLCAVTLTVVAREKLNSILE